MIRPMASRQTPSRLPGNAPGDWYVDSSCINCSASRTIAPGVFAEQNDQTIVAKQPETPEERMIAWRARLCCPTASIHTEGHADVPAGVFPEEVTPHVYRLGYNARSSWGAHSFAVRRAVGTLMVDSPRWTKQIVATFEQWGGLSDILLTHRDDVADAGKYAEHFKSSVWIHEADRKAAPYATNIIKGAEPVMMADDLTAIPLPGHTKGSVAYLFDTRYLFTGDSLAWDFDENDLVAWQDVAWHSWDEQRRSLRRLLDYRFEWVLAGHGASRVSSADEIHSRLAALLDRLG